MFTTISAGRVLSVAVAALAATASAGAASTEPGDSAATGANSERPEPCAPDESSEAALTTDVVTATSAPAEPVIDPGDGGVYAPAVDAAGFVGTVDNPYLPLTPGSRWKYEGHTDEGTELIDVEVLEEQRDIQGISATVVRDTVSLDGVVIEDTYDWYAQDAEGNVWYLGEDSTSFECGVPVSTEGSWEYGVDGALPGIVMPADPQPGVAYRQEFSPGIAEDLVRIEEVGVARTIDLGAYADVVITTDWNPFDPAVVEQKWYARDIGLIYEAHIAGGDETVQLVEFTPSS